MSKKYRISNKQRGKKFIYGGFCVNRVHLRNFNTKQTNTLFSLSSFNDSETGENNIELQKQNQNNNNNNNKRRKKENRGTFFICQGIIKSNNIL